MAPASLYRSHCHLFVCVLVVCILFVSWVLVFGVLVLVLYCCHVVVVGVFGGRGQVLFWPFLI